MQAVLECGQLRSQLDKQVEDSRQQQKALDLACDEAALANARRLDLEKLQKAACQKEATDQQALLSLRKRLQNARLRSKAVEQRILVLRTAKQAAAKKHATQQQALLGMCLREKATARRKLRGKTHALERLTVFTEQLEKCKVVAELLKLGEQEQQTAVAQPTNGSCSTGQLRNPKQQGISRQHGRRRRQRKSRQQGISQQLGRPLQQGKPRHQAAWQNQVVVQPARQSQAESIVAYPEARQRHQHVTVHVSC